MKSITTEMLGSFAIISYRYPLPLRPTETFTFDRDNIKKTNKKISVSSKINKI